MTDQRIKLTPLIATRFIFLYIYIYMCEDPEFFFQGVGSGPKDNWASLQKEVRGWLYVILQWEYLINLNFSRVNTPFLDPNML